MIFMGVGRTVRTSLVLSLSRPPSIQDSTSIAPSGVGVGGLGVVIFPWWFQGECLWFPDTSATPTASTSPCMPDPTIDTGAVTYHSLGICGYVNFLHLRIIFCPAVALLPHGQAVVLTMWGIPMIVSATTVSFTHLFQVASKSKVASVIHIRYILSLLCRCADVLSDVEPGSNLQCCCRTAFFSDVFCFQLCSLCVAWWGFYLGIGVAHLDGGWGRVGCEGASNCHSLQPKVTHCDHLPQLLKVRPVHPLPPLQILT